MSPKVARILKVILGAGAVAFVLWSGYWFMVDNHFIDEGHPNGRFTPLVEWLHKVFTKRTGLAS
ncbi:hypothetical protein EON79_19125 [bacterium]|nr:MAG: hypothetical protein EON79_19125 [bacterium]